MSTETKKPEEPVVQPTQPVIIQTDDFVRKQYYPVLLLSAFLFVLGQGLVVWIPSKEWIGYSIMVISIALCLMMTIYCWKRKKDNDTSSYTKQDDVIMALSIITVLCMVSGLFLKIGRGEKIIGGRIASDKPSPTKRIIFTSIYFSIMFILGVSLVVDVAEFGGKEAIVANVLIGLTIFITLYAVVFWRPTDKKGNKESADSNNAHMEKTINSGPLADKNSPRRQLQGVPDE